MIPLKLQLKNFLSYGTKLQIVDFGSYPLICLSGKNGHGKSALLDAMTWAIWGQARKTSGTLKPDAQLLRLGQSSMLVMFDFLFNGQTYRIRREFALTRSSNPYVSLEFGILDQETMRPLSEKTIRETQAKIETLLGLTFDSFINSAFLRQGQSNEFSKKSPKERKEVLASILQLDTYETLRKVAQEKVKQAQTELHHVRQLQERFAVDLEKKETLQQKKQILTQELELIGHQESNNLLMAQELELKKNNLLQQQQQHSMLTYQYKQLCDEKDKEEHKLLEIFKQWRTIHQKQHLLRNLQGLEEQYQHVSKELSAVQHHYQEILNLKEQFLQKKESEQNLINRLRETHGENTKKKELVIERLQTEQLYNQKTRSELEKNIATQAKNHEILQKQYQDLINHLSKKEKKFQDLQLLEQQFEKRKMYYHTWIARANSIHDELNNIEQKKHFTRDASNPSCPLCEQNLSASRKRFLQTKFSKLTTSLEHRQHRLSRILKELKRTLIEHHAQQEVLKKEQALFTAQESTIKELEKTIHTSKESDKQLHQGLMQQAKIEATLQQTIDKETTELHHMRTTLEQDLNNHELYQSYKKQFQQIQQALNQISYDPESHRKLTDHMQDLQNKLQEAREFSQKLAQQHQRKEDVQNLCAHLRVIKKRQQSFEQLDEIFTKLQEEHKQVTKQEYELQTNMKNLQLKKEQLLQEKGMLEHEQAHLEKLEQDHAQQQQTHATLTTTIDDYQTLATALGKDGIQALLIEDALPEIEQEANDLLSQLTNNQSHIIIESLRDLKKGGTKETLDIKISDAMGIRPYELFSGGEAFRIDFALRIAISKLLARRSGTSLQTLIIDEGFGSQDEEGLQLLMEAIYTIQSNFEKIIIVSHLPTMKDQFPVHFFVNKEPQGSIVTIIEH